MLVPSLRAFPGFQLNKLSKCSADNQIFLALDRAPSTGYNELPNSSFQLTVVSEIDRDVFQFLSSWFELMKGWWIKDRSSHGFGGFTHYLNTNDHFQRKSNPGKGKVVLQHWRGPGKRE
jgi:hypothetical protein